MSSRLNPRDYDLGELRDAVRETSRRRDDGRPVGRGDVSRRDDSRSVERRAEPEQQEERDSGRSGARRYEEDENSEENRSNGSTFAGRHSVAGRSTEVRSGFGRSRDGLSDGHGVAATRQDDRASTGRLRQNTARFARSKSRDRTVDGEPRRRGRSEDGGGTRRRTEPRSERPDTGGRRAGRGTDAYELYSHVGGDVERPYLPRLPDSYDAQVEIFEWLEGLLGTCGRELTLEALEYYESVEWLSEDSRERLEEFVEGLTAAEPPEPRSLDVDHHRESLRYVARLARRIDR